jgi:hypothetical protein
MRSLVWSLVLPLLAGCSGTNVVAGEEQPTGASLQASLPTFCQTTCDRLRQCPASADCASSGDCASVDDSCEPGCSDYFAPYVNAGDACAAVGQRLKNCIGRLGCADLGGSDPCEVTAAESAECPDANGSPQTTGEAGPNGGSVYVGMGYAGSAAVGGSAPMGDGGAGGSAAVPVNANPVTCMGAYGAGGGMSDLGVAVVLCDEGRDGCSDGHTYSWMCSRDSQGNEACSCFLDGQVAGAFAPGASCPVVAEINVGCGWALTQ